MSIIPLFLQELIESFFFIKIPGLLGFDIFYIFLLPKLPDVTEQLTALSLSFLGIYEICEEN
jgi:hypothetical protein